MIFLKLGLAFWQRPVSYTHLDVYKRQAGHKAHPQSFAGEGEGGRQLQILHGSGKSDGVPVKKQYLTPLINKMLFYITKLSVIIVPVSYTHLDVYKRQG